MISEWKGDALVVHHIVSNGGNFIREQTITRKIVDGMLLMVQYDTAAFINIFHRNIFMELKLLSTSVTSNRCLWTLNSTLPLLEIRFNTLGSEQNGRHFANDIFKYIPDQNLCILIKIPHNFIPTDPIDNESSLVRVMGWHRKGDKPLPEPMMTQSKHVQRYKVC